jgi:uncharacterized protein YciU (UPF0263 family)
MARGKLLNAHTRYAPQLRQAILDDFEVFCMQQEERIAREIMDPLDDWALLLPHQDFDPTNYEVEIRK